MAIIINFQKLAHENFIKPFDSNYIDKKIHVHRLNTKIAINLHYGNRKPKGTLKGRICFGVKTQ